MLNLGNPRDRVLPFILFCGCLAFGAFFFFELVKSAALPVVGGLALMAFFAGGLFMWWSRREP